MLESMLESPDRRSYCCPWRSHVVAYLHKGLLGSLRYRFCYRFGAWCNLDFFKDSALKNGRWFTLCLSSRDCSFGGPGDTPCCSLCEDISLKPQIEIHAKGFPQQSSGVIVFFPPYRFTVVCRCSKKNGHANTNSLGGGFL